MIHSLSEHGDAYDQNFRESFCQQYNTAIQYPEFQLESKLNRRNQKDSFANFLAYALKDIDKTQDTVEVYFVHARDFPPKSDNEISEIEQTLRSLGLNLYEGKVKCRETPSFFAINGNGQTFCSEAALKRDSKIAILLHQLQGDSKKENRIPFFAQNSPKAIKREFLEALRKDISDKPEIDRIYKILSAKHDKTPAQIEKTVLSGILTHRVKDFLIETKLISSSTASPQARR